MPTIANSFIAQHLSMSTKIRMIYTNNSMKKNIRSICPSGISDLHFRALLLFLLFLQDSSSHNYQSGCYSVWCNSTTIDSVLSTRVVLIIFILFDVIDSSWMVSTGLFLSYWHTETKLSYVHVLTSRVDEYGNPEDFSIRVLASYLIEFFSKQNKSF